MLNINSLIMDTYSSLSKLSVKEQKVIICYEYKCTVTNLPGWDNLLSYLRNVNEKYNRLGAYNYSSFVILSVKERKYKLFFEL